MKAPVEKLPPDSIPEFMAIAPADYPKKLKEKALNRRHELEAMQRVGQRKKAGMIIDSVSNCEVPREGSELDIRTLAMAGYVEISENEKEYVQQRTKCTERDLLCRFTLQIRDKKLKKGEVLRRYFLYCRASCDPLMVMIAAYREHIRDKNTPFFGAAGPVCTK